MALYEANSDLIMIGAYKPGTNKALDEAITKMDKINAFLKQSIKESFDLADTVEMVKEAIS
jgi:flagellum-specific ATP synthase